MSVLGRGLGGVLSVDRGWPPLPTRPQQYCDPASLVLLPLNSTSDLLAHRQSNLIESDSRQKHQMIQLIEVNLAVEVSFHKTRRHENSVLKTAS